MQATDLVFDMVLLFAFITFYGTVAWGLIRYSKRLGGFLVTVLSLVKNKVH